MSASRVGLGDQDRQRVYEQRCRKRKRNTIQYNTIQYNTIQYNTIQYSFYYKLTFTGDGSCLNPIDIALSAINGQNMSNIYSYV